MSEADEMANAFGMSRAAAAPMPPKAPRIKLTTAEKESIAAFAQSALQIAKFFEGIVDRDTVTEGQHAIVERWRGWYPRVCAGLPVKNKFAGCWERRCKSRATVVQHHVARCAKHAAEAAHG